MPKKKLRTCFCLEFFLSIFFNHIEALAISSFWMEFSIIYHCDAFGLSNMSRKILACFWWIGCVVMYYVMKDQRKVIKFGRANSNRMSFKVPPALSSDHAALLRNKTKSTQWGQSLYKVAFEIAAKPNFPQNKLKKMEFNKKYCLFKTQMNLIFHGLHGPI